MHKSKIKGKRHLLVLFMLVIFLLSGCGDAGQKARKPPGDFSRGLPLSAEAVSPPAAAVSPDGDLIRVVIPTRVGDSTPIFSYIQIDQEGRIVLNQALELSLAPYIRSPKVVEIGEDLHLVWAARESTKQGWELWHAIINPEAQVTSAPQLISDGTERVSQFEISGGYNGDLVVVWEDSQSFSIHLTRISEGGTIISEPEMVITQGELPALIGDEDALHIAWMQGDVLLYEQINSKTSFPLEGVELTKIQVAVGNRLDGPVIGVTNNHVFLFWSILRQVGLEAGTAITESLVFPRGEPSQTQRGLIPIFPVSEDFLLPYQGSLSLSQVIPAPPEDYMSTDFILNPSTLVSPSNGVLAVAVSATQDIRLDSHIQIAVGIFEGGVYQGYTVGTRTTEISQNPFIALDADGNLHLIWQEGSSGNRIYYATTSPEAKGRLDRVGLADIPNLILSGGLEALTGIMLFPFAFPWMAIGLVIMIVLRLARNDEDVTQPLSKALLALALLSYQVSKLLFLPDMLVYIPFSAWLDIPEGVGMFLRVAVPIIIIILGVGAAEWRRRRRGDSPTSSLGYYVTVVIIDTLLTLSVYGVIFLGEY